MAQTNITTSQEEIPFSNNKLKNVDLQKLHSPFRYAGGKFYGLKHILPIIPSHTVYVEPLCGGARVFFAKPKNHTNWINDIDNELINCYKTIRDRSLDLIEFLKYEKATKERHTFYKNQFKPKNDFERAARWFYLNRTSFSGIMNMQNCYWGYGDKYSLKPSGWAGRIKECSEKLQKVKITRMDFEKVIDSCPDGTFLFVDPPYYASDQSKFYTHIFEEKDHLRLAKALHRNSKRIKFLLTYDDCNEIRDMYSWCKNHVGKEWTYTISRTDDQVRGIQRKGKRSAGKELFIMNYKVKTNLTDFI